MEFYGETIHNFYLAVISLIRPTTHLTLPNEKLLILILLTAEVGTGLTRALVMTYMLTPVFIRTQVQSSLASR